MESPAPDNPSAAAQANVKKYFREEIAGQRLPSLPFIAGKILEMVQDPDLNIQKLCRVLSDDIALAARVLAVSRSPIYGQRTSPKRLLDAVNVLGLRTLTSVVVANATHSLCLKGNRVSELLWDHSLGVALAMRLFSRRAGDRDGELAFLTGLMHDVGQMILMHRDPRGFERLAREVKNTRVSIIGKEQEVYGFDHALIGLTLLDSWNLDARIGVAVLNHHNDFSGDDYDPLAALLSVADYVCSRGGLGFVGDPAVPPLKVLRRCGCADEEALDETITQIRQAYLEESAIFKLA